VRAADMNKNFSGPGKGFDIFFAYSLWATPTPD
jgi:hypothetical protein